MTDAVDLQKLPHMTRWFNPVLLCKLLLQVVVADLFGQYADRRLIHAALDPAPLDELIERADLALAPDAEGAVWIDFVADLGDGFDSTYAIASLIAQDRLAIGAHTLPRGGALFMGGDEVYPTASYRAYKTRLVTPYRLAFPDRPGEPHPSVLMIPGNHDWYDGLDSFLALFCRKKRTPVGHWWSNQRRSYFAAKITDTCWVWAVDIALTENMDQPQAEYFVAMARSMQQGASIILCSAEPGWYDAEVKAASYRILTYAATIAANAERGLRIPLVLSGDTHHYCRYSGRSGTQFITSGGGGAFLHGTHQLRDEIKANWMKGEDAVLSLKTTPGEDHAPTETPACYPTREQSRVLLKGDLAFPWRNWDFSLFLGGVFLALGFPLTQAWRADVAVGVSLVLAAGLCAYTGYQERRTTKAVLLALVHALAQSAALIGLCWAALALDAKWFDLHAGPWWGWACVMAAVMAIAGSALSGFLFGLNLYLTCRYADLNHNDAFSAMRLDTHRHFLRIRIDHDTLRIYAVGIDAVPQRCDWHASTATQGPRYLPPRPLPVRLIEEPIVVRRHEAVTTQEVKKPSEVTEDDQK